LGQLLAREGEVAEGEDLIVRVPPLFEKRRSSLPGGGGGGEVTFFVLATTRFDRV
jgi:hypothetical protein